MSRTNTVRGANPPLALIVAGIVRHSTERVGALSALTIGLLLIAAGPVLYFLSSAHRTRPNRSRA